MKAKIIGTHDLCEILSKDKIVVFIFPFQENKDVDYIEEIKKIYEIDVPEEGHDWPDNLYFDYQFATAKTVMVEFEDWDEAHDYIMRLDEKRGRGMYEGYACMYVDGEFVEENT